MIQAGAPLISGNAAALQLEPAAGVLYSRVLRRLDGNFVGATDPTAVVVYQGEDADVIDLTAANDTAYFYKDYGWNGAAFVDDGGDPATVTPAVNYTALGPDVRVVVASRLDLGLRQELQRGLLKLKGNPSKVTVQLAPPSFKDTAWPVVSVMVNSDVPASRGIGETILDGIGEVDETMLSSYSLQADSWSQNADERHQFHEALRRIIQANLGVFTALGFVQIEWRLTDVNFLDPGQFPVPVYCASLILSFQAPAGVVSAQTYEVIDAVDVLLTVAINGVIDADGA